MPELRQWAPSRWSRDRIHRFLKHMRMHLIDSWEGGDITKSGYCEALMSIDVALSWVWLPNDPMQRAQAIANATGRPVTVITEKLLGD